MFDGLKKIIEIQNDVAGLIPFTAINEDRAIFAVQNGKLVGMVIREDSKWIVRLGGHGHVAGAWGSLKACLKSASEFNYSFYINDG